MDPEQRALRRSAWGNLFFAVLGLGFAASSESEAILLDGFFSLIAWVMSLLTLRVARLVQRPGDDRFHFGYAAFEPGLNTVKGLLMLGVCGFSLASAVNALLHEGRPINPGWALLYTAIAFLGGLTLATIQGRAAKRTGSPLLEVDVHNWRIDTLLSGGVGIAFLAAFFVQGTGWSWTIPYVDPLLVTVLVLILVREPVRIVVEGAGELLAVAPEESVQLEVRERFAELIQEYPIRKYSLRMLKTGRTFYLLAHVVVQPDTPLDRFEELDKIRRRIESGIKDLHPSWEVDTVFVADEALA